MLLEKSILENENFEAENIDIKIKADKDYYFLSNVTIVSKKGKIYFDDIDITQKGVRRYLENLGANILIDGSITLIVKNEILLSKLELAWANKRDSFPAIISDQQNEKSMYSVNQGCRMGRIMNFSFGRMDCSDALFRSLNGSISFNDVNILETNLANFLIRRGFDFKNFQIDHNNKVYSLTILIAQKETNISLLSSDIENYKSAPPENIDTKSFLVGLKSGFLTRSPRSQPVEKPADLLFREAAGKGDIKFMKEHNNPLYINLKGGQSGKTALHRAAENGHFEVVEWLLHHGALNIRDGKEKTADELAKEAGHDAIAEYLLNTLLLKARQRVKF